MATIHVDPGVCGMVSTVTVGTEDGQNCRLSVLTPCEAVKAMAEELAEFDGFAAAFTKFSENPVYAASTKHYRHAACPVPSAIIKAAEMACGLALPKDVSFKPEK